MPAYLVEDAERQERKAHVVDYEEAFARQRLPVSHVFGPRPHHHQVHKGEGESRRVVVEQQPTPHPLV